ncbi:C40 family peptidase [Modestobacter versicolor]|uniref:CHAP domain-containing protein n=1 Tax=Modestobacter versicolor TaxID=429133 RepID=A0A839Y6L2_9ACTN|nr:CHAP domain-containing protein [Modestobacter versicolor]MBB3676982.1 hypothetical protein [Modestobacter versicolor]
MTQDLTVEARDDELPAEPPHRRPPLSRRAFLAAGAAALAAGGAGLVVATRTGTPTSGPAGSTPLPPAAPPPAPPVVAGTLDAVLAAVEQSTGGRLLGSPWSAWSGVTSAAWSSSYVCWLLRDNGVPPTADPATLHAALAQAGRVGPTPQPGALVFYHRGDETRPVHVGLVTSVTAGVPQTVEGDHPMNLPHAERFVRRFARPWDERVTFALPVYA